MRLISFIRLTILFTLVAIIFAHTAVAQPNADEGIRSVLLAGKFRTEQELDGMSPNGQRNTLITELASRTKDTVGQYQSLNDADLAGAGALWVYLRSTGSRSNQQIKTMSADDMRNTVIVEVADKTGYSRHDLQGLSNMKLVKLGSK